MYDGKDNVYPTYSGAGPPQITDASYDSPNRSSSLGASTISPSFNSSVNYPGDVYDEFFEPLESGYVNDFVQNNEPVIAPQQQLPQCRQGPIAQHMFHPSSSTPNPQLSAPPLSHYPQYEVQPTVEYVLPPGYVVTEDDFINRKRARVEEPDIKYVPVTPSTSPDENEQRTIRFFPYEAEKWTPICSETGTQLQNLTMFVIPDKGFKFLDEHGGVFVCQKKNHFQVTVLIETTDPEPPALVWTSTGQFVTIKQFKLEFSGAKAEMKNVKIDIEESKSDRKVVPLQPLLIDKNVIPQQHATRFTASRLHFASATANNQLKNGKLGADQRYFLLIVRLLAIGEDGKEYLVQANQSERIIVRTGNPATFGPKEQESAASNTGWHSNDVATYTISRVAIGGDMPIGSASLTVHGDMVNTGRRQVPCDERLKHNIRPAEPSRALDNVKNIEICDFSYKPEIADQWGLPEADRHRRGVIAQQIAEVLPDAVKDFGDFITVDDNRVFYETVVATQELIRLTGDLDAKMDQKLDEISQRLTRYARRKKMLTSMASNLSGETGDQTSTVGCSRTSIESFFRSKKPESENTNHQCPNHHTAPLLYSPFTQRILACSVFFMALCVLFMAGLYFVDWHHRNFGGSKHGRPYYQQNSSTDGPLKMQLKPDVHFARLHKPPAVGGQCQGDHCHSYCCSSAVKFSEELLPYDDETLCSKKIDRNSPLTQGLAIHIPALNLTVDRQYCYCNSCNDAEDRYTLYIPVSYSYPTFPLELEIRTPSGMIANSCGALASKPQLCNEGAPEEYRLPSSVQLNENTFELTAGVFHMSGYRFRIGYTTEACYVGSDERSNSLELNLIFYRTCS